MKNTQKLYEVNVQIIYDHLLDLYDDNLSLKDFKLYCLRTKGNSGYRLSPTDLMWLLLKLVELHNREDYTDKDFSDSYACFSGSVFQILSYVLKSSSTYIAEYKDIRLLLWVVKTLYLSDSSHRSILKYADKINPNIVDLYKYTEEELYSTMNTLSNKGIFFGVYSFIRHEVRLKLCVNMSSNKKLTATYISVLNKTINVVNKLYTDRS